MSMKRIQIAGLLTSVALAAGSASAQTFNERYAAWQGAYPGSPPAPAPAPQSTPRARVMPSPQSGGVPVTETVPEGMEGQSQKILSNVYSAPYHAPNYNAPWTNNQCATCSHNPTFEAASDPIGTCGYAGGGWLPGTVAGGACGCGQGGDCCGDACGGCGGGHGGCFGCGQCGGLGGGCDFGPYCNSPMVWLRIEALMWWRQGRNFPSLVTTDPTTESSTTAGALPDAQTIFGGSRVAANMQGGGRIDWGFFINPMQTIGFGDRVYGVGKDNSNFSVASNNIPVLAIPFHDFDTGVNDALLVAYPGLRTGNINITSTSSFFGNDVYGRFLLCRDCNTRIDFITGWNYTRLADNLGIQSVQTVTETGGNIPQGTVTTIVDQFQSQNLFNGGILGLQWNKYCGVWTWQTMGRVSLGNMHESLNINGSTTVVAPPPTGGTNTTAGGLFTAGSNTGHHERDEFTAIWELGLNLNYRFRPCTQLNIGYSLIYINDVLLPANNIDTSIGTTGSVTHPIALFNHSSYWIQGLNLGISQDF
jgi:hypothetical protein